MNSSPFDFLSSFQCLYGDADRRDRVLFEFHSFSIIAVVSLCCVLLNSTKLRRIYLPLFHIVNSALLLQLLSNVLFFWFYPYSENRGNCAEILVSRIYITLIAFGELHQVYFIANVLGLSRFKFDLGRWSLSLPQALQLATVLVVVTILSSVFIRRLFMMCHDIWALFIVFLQLYVIKQARKQQEAAMSLGEGTEAILDVNNDAVTIFENLSWLQLIPLLVALADRMLEFDGIFLFTSLDGVMLIVEFLGSYLFYVKIMVLQEKANTMNVEVHRV